VAFITDKYSVALIAVVLLKKSRKPLQMRGKGLYGIQEVSGSIPLISTKKSCNRNGYRTFSFARRGRGTFRVE